MKRLFWTLLCLILLGTQINQAALAFSPMGTNVSTADIKNSLLEQGLINDSQPAMATPLISFSGSAVLETSKATSAGGNAAAAAGFVTQSNFLNLNTGNILVNPEKDVVINTQEGAVSIGSGAAIFVMESGQDTVIYDLYQARPEQVSVLVDRHKLVMHPGCMLVLTKEKNKNFEQLAVNCHLIRYRQAQEIDLSETAINAYVANFSIFSALVKIQPLKELVYSKDKKDQQLLQKLLKSAVMLRT